MQTCFRTNLPSGTAALAPALLRAISVHLNEYETFMSVVRNILGALVVSLALSACGQVASEPGCNKDSDCASGSSCVLRACVPRVKGTTQAWAVELVPKSELNLAPTENGSVTFGTEPVQLKVEKKAKVEGQVEGLGMTEANAATGSTMRVLLSIPSAIGRSERQFETEATRPPNDQGPLRFAFYVPESAVGQGAKFTLFPATPLDQVLPVWSVSLATLGPTVIIGVPKSNETAVIEGVLQDELEQAPAMPYVARALLGDRLVSNIYKTDAQGRFKLKVPNGPANNINLDLVKVELAPADATAVEPRLRADVSAMKLNLGVLRLPPRAKAQVLDVPVAALGKNSKIPGVTIRFAATLDGAFGGKATVAREVQTDKDGIAHVILLPGPAGQTLDYAVTVVPPPNSEFAARCFQGYSVATLPAGLARVGASIELGNKLEVTGRVTSADGAPQANVILTAIRQSVIAAQDCGVDVLSTPITVTSGPDGSYRMLVDPGRYRFEYEPPMGSAAAFSADNDVLIDKSLQRMVNLPGGALATGVVSSAAGDGVSGCEVRVFNRAMEGQIPELRARTRTGADGRFSIVLPR
jgi:hypothetical protein